jgi:hypothetical protein
VKLRGQGKDNFNNPAVAGLNLLIFDIQPFAGLFSFDDILPRISSGANHIKSLQDFK